MAITITCPECDKQLKASSEVLGKKIRCKACGATFVGKDTSAPDKKSATKKDAKPAAKAPKPAANPADDDDVTSYGVTHEYIGRRCPNCTEPMDDKQTVCLECGYNTTTRERVRRIKVKDTTGGDVFLWLLPGMICVLVSIIVLTIWLLYVFMVDETSFGNEVWYDFLGGKGAKIYTGLLSLFIIYKCTRFAIKRLIQDNKPPEHEDQSREDDEEDYG